MWQSATQSGHAPAQTQASDAPASDVLFRTERKLRASAKSAAEMNKVQKSARATIVPTGLC
jgi:hypothetical protein